MKVIKTIPTYVETAKYAKPTIVKDQNTTVEMVAFRATAIKTNDFKENRHNSEVTGRIINVKFSDLRRLPRYKI